MAENDIQIPSDINNIYGDSSFNNNIIPFEKKI